MVTWNPRLRNVFVRNLFLPGIAAGSSYLQGTTNTLALTIYGGAQPSAADFATNWVSTYQNNHLVHWQSAVVSIPNVGDEALGIAAVCTTLPSAATAANTGTAAWGVCWKTNIAEASLSGALPDTVYMLYPVSGTGGSGIMKLTNTSISSGSSYLFEEYAIQVPTVN